MDTPRGTLGSTTAGDHGQAFRASLLLIIYLDQPKVSFYENASHFAVYNPIMGENIQITQIQTSKGAGEY